MMNYSTPQQQQQHWTPAIATNTSSLNSSDVANVTSNSSVQSLKSPTQIALLACLTYAMASLVNHQHVIRRWFTPRNPEYDIIHPDANITDTAKPLRI